MTLGFLSESFVSEKGCVGVEYGRVHIFVSTMLKLNMNKNFQFLDVEVHLLANSPERFFSPNFLATLVVLVVRVCCLILH